MSAVILPSQGVWEGEKRQLFLAPMSGVSELPYRLLAKECGADITITEFTSSSALTREVTKSWARVESHKDESPFIPQIFGGNPEEMVQAAKMLDGNLTRFKILNRQQQMHLLLVQLPKWLHQLIYQKVRMRKFRSLVKKN